MNVCAVCEFGFKVRTRTFDHNHLNEVNKKKYSCEYGIPLLMNFK